MINQAVIDRFLTRPLEAYDWLKQVSESELNQALGELFPDGIGRQAAAGTGLWLHQRACLLLLNEVKRFMLHLEQGGGKTLITLSLLKLRKQLGDKIKAIVFVPYITSVETWVEETAKHTPDLKCVPLTGTTKQNLAQLQTDGDLFVICYQSAVAMVSEPAPNKNGKTKWQLNAKQVREYFSGFNMLVLDEAHRCKSVSALTYRMCRAISAQCEWAVGLTGTPFGRDLTDLWPQFYLIDFGETLGPTLGFYREVFFTSKLGWFGGTDYKFKQKLLPKLHRMIKHKSIRYELDEFIDMPEKAYVVKKLTLPETNLGYCQEALKRITEALKGNASQNYQVIESNYLQLRQLSSGFMTLKGEDDDRVQIEFETNPKLEALMELIEGLPEGRKAVVFHWFVHSSHTISARLKAAKIPHARIWSGQRHPIEELRRFKADPACKIMVLNTRSGSASLNLQGASYVAFYEQPDSPIDRQQAERRVWRPGQTQRVAIYDFLVRGTWDAKLHAANLAGENLLKAVLSGKT